MRRLSGTWLAAAVAVMGCAPAPPAPAGTGAREAARDFFESVARQDWPRGYALLADESRARVGPERFAKLAAAYRRGLGFEPDSVQVIACDEDGAQAVAHVTLTGRGPHRHRYKDAAVLRRGGSGWGVVLPADFGRAGKP
jgi:hypothetical protein